MESVVMDTIEDALSDWVSEYRFEMCQKAGYSDEAAREIGNSPWYQVDLHTAITALKCGSEYEALWLLGLRWDRT